MPHKSWNIPIENKRFVQILSEECEISPFVAEILVHRGVASLEQATEFLDHSNPLEDPFVMTDMRHAVARIRTAITEGEAIVVYGDYDCDGVTATTILTTYLMSQDANVSYYIPDREKDGYGLNKAALKMLADQGASLVITVDNGISAVSEVAYANECGLTVIVTDHHQVGRELPPAYAVLNPHRQDCHCNFAGLCGVGVAFKLIVALEHSDRTGAIEFDHLLEQFSDLLAIGTVADVVPLVSENRLFVKRGLEALRQTDNMGLTALMQVAGLDRDALTSRSIAFTIAPRINAAGRMGHASLAVELFLTQDPEQAQALASELDQLNSQRKQQEQDILASIDQAIHADPTLLNRRVLAFYGEGWHPGIIGIVSARVLERFGKPNLIMSLSDGMLKGSARSVEQFSLFQALSHCEEHLIKYGGHSMAAGFLLKESSFPAFSKALEAYAQSQYPSVMPPYVYTVDKRLEPHDLSIANIKDLSVLEPFGACNQPPIFLMPAAKILAVSSVSDDRHTRLSLRFGDATITAMLFGRSPQTLCYRVGMTIDLIATISLNLYQGREGLSIAVKDLRPSGFSEHRYFKAKAFYEQFRRGEALPSANVKTRLPSRDEITELYKYLRDHDGHRGEIDELYALFGDSSINYHKFRAVIDILQEVGLLTLSPLLDRIVMHEIVGKADLETAPTMKALRAISL